MKTILTIAIMAVLMMAAFAMPIASAEENDSDSSEAIALYNDTSDLPENIVIAPLPETPVSEDEAAIDQEAEDDLNESAGTGKVVWKQLQLWLTFKEDKKVQLELQIAKLRLIQAKVAAQNNNTEAMEKALEAHDRIMEKVQERMKNIDSADDEKEANETATKIVGLQRAIQVHERRIAKLGALLENENLTDEQIAKIQSKISHMENVTAQLMQIAEAKQEQIKTKLMALGNLTEEQAEELMEQKKHAGENNDSEDVDDVDDGDTDNIESEVEDENETEDEDESAGSDNKQSGQA